MQKTFLHVDMDAFFAAVEQRDNPAWRGKPLVVGSAPDQRGVVSAASYEARKFGIHSAMPSRQAGELCPHAIFVPPNGKKYAEASGKIFQIFEYYTPLIEPLSIDEAFLDVSGSQRLFGSPESIAKQIKQTIREETQLVASVGIAPNKFLAKIASDMDKPDGLTIVPRKQSEIVAFLAPLSVSRLWGVGKVMTQTLQQVGIQSVGDVQEMPLQQLSKLIGKSSAEHLSQLAQGYDSRPIELGRAEKSISREYTFPKDCSDPDELHDILLDLVDDVAGQLRALKKFAVTGHIKLRWQGFKTITRQKQFIRPSCDSHTLRDTALDLFYKEELIRPVRLIGFGVSRLVAKRENEQLSLFQSDAGELDKREALSYAIDTIKTKFGDKIIPTRQI